METFNVGKIEEFEDKSKKVVTIGDEEVGIFRLGDEFFAWRNICPHQGGPICQGRIFSFFNFQAKSFLKHLVKFSKI